MMVPSRWSLKMRRASASLRWKPRARMRPWNNLFRHGGEGEVNYDEIVAEKRLLLPLDHAEPSRCTISVTGLTHLGSAESRDAMHAKLAADDLSDSMRMFKLGLEGGKPNHGSIGVQPEWAYKGMVRGRCLPSIRLVCRRGPKMAAMKQRSWASTSSATKGRSCVGFSLGNEYSDHVMEQQNYLYLAHSKLRECSYGPEALLGELPSDVTGTVRVSRAGSTIWSDKFISGEDNMSHTIRNLEHHHFKYRGFRRPGDVHVHFFGASVLSFAAGVRPRSGDVFEVESKAFGRPLRNPLIADEKTELISVKVL